MGFCSGLFPDGESLRTGPRGFCLSGVALKQKQRSGLQIPTQAKQFACLRCKERAPHGI